MSEYIDYGGYIDYDSMDFAWINDTFRLYGSPDPKDYKIVTRIVVENSDREYGKAHYIDPDNHEEVERCIGWIQSQIDHLTQFKEKLLEFPGQK